MPSLRQLRRQLAAPDTSTRSLRLDAGHDAVKRRWNPRWKRSSNQFETPLDLHRARYGANFIEGRHFNILNDHLVQLAQRTITALLVFMPPQHGKSQFGSVSFLSWYMAENPTDNIILTAYNTSHAKGFSRESRNLTQEFKEELGVSVATHDRSNVGWSLQEGGRMVAAGLDGEITGKACDLMVADDPIKNPKQAHSPTQKKAILDNWKQACETRMQPDGIRLVIMTRWAQDDLGGWLLENQPTEWTVLSLEALCETPEEDPLGRKAGEALWPNHYDEQTLRERKQRVGPYVWAAMYQQRPQRVPPDVEAMIPFGDCMRAIRPMVHAYNAPVDIGCDVARSPKGDRIVYAVARGGREIIKLTKKRGQPTTQTAADLAALAIQYNARSVRIDDTGVGGGVTDRLWEIAGEPTAHHRLRSLEIIPFNFAQKAWDAELHADIRTEMWFHVAQLLRDGECALPADDQLFDDLCAPQLLASANNRNKLESKENLKRRGISSTDEGDAVALALYPNDWLERVMVE